MKRYRYPTPTLPRQPELPLRERILCGVIVAIVVLGAVWVLVIAGRH